MSLLNNICETCRFHALSNVSFPCCDCSSRDRWEAAEDIRVNTKALLEIETKLERLKAQNKLMFEALMCLPGAMGATVTGAVCEICTHRGEDCEDCLFDKAIREAMER
jgi:hypothetical protein